jgi:hypothetical protein
LSVACLLYRDDLSTKDLLKKFTASCSPALYHLPLKVKKFRASKGVDLLQSIHKYYTEEGTVSPVIQYRRNVSLLVGNTLGRIKPYSVSFNEYTSSITFECPYMCYMVPEAVEIEHVSTEPLTEDSVHISCGTEYLLMNPNSTEVAATTTGNVLHKEVECERPCVYLSLSMTNLRNVQWQSVKVYGEAICFV